MILFKSAGSPGLGVHADQVHGRYKDGQVQREWSE